MKRAPTKPRLILASSSPRRRRLLAEAGYEFDAIDPPIHEPAEEHSTLLPRQQAEALAYFKARAVAEADPEAMVLGADTLVARGDEVLGKPAEAAEARRMLETLSATRHAVITGVALLGADSMRLIASDTTYVTMRAMQAEELDAYIDSGEWEGKAGAYAIQETADRFVERVDGSFTNVVGLPMELLERMVRELSDHGACHKVI